MNRKIHPQQGRSTWCGVYIIFPPTYVHRVQAAENGKELKPLDPIMFAVVRVMTGLRSPGGQVSLKTSNLLWGFKGNVR